MQDHALLIALFPVNNVLVLDGIRVGSPLILRQADVKIFTAAGARKQPVLTVRRARHKLGGCQCDGTEIW